MVELALLAPADLAGEGVAVLLEVADVLDVAAVGLVDVDVSEGAFADEPPPASTASMTQLCRGPQLYEDAS